MAIVAAGPLANLMLAIVLYWVVFMHGVPGLKPTLGDVPPGTPAAIAQVKPGETILSINGDPVPSWQELHWQLLDLALKQDEVRIETQAADGASAIHVLDMSGLAVMDLDGDFLDKLGLHLYQPVVLPVIGSLTEGDVAQRTGLQAGDRILRANGMTMQRWMEVVEVIRAHPGQTIQFEILRKDRQRGDMTLTLSVVPRSDVESGKTVGKIGAGPKTDEAAWKAMITEVSYGPLEAMKHSLRKTWETSAISLKMMGKMEIGRAHV